MTHAHDKREPRRRWIRPAIEPLSRVQADEARVSVVVPAKNEAKNLEHVLPALPDPVHEVILVDGHSSDGTVEAARELRPDIRVVHQPRSGKGNALACGFEASRGDITVMIDADGSTDPGEIPRFVEALLRGADFAKGSRFLPGGGSEDITGIRARGNLALTALVNLILGTRFTDLCYGYNAFWSRIMPALGLRCHLDGCPCLGDGFEIETLIALRVVRAGLHVVEVPSFERNRVHGESNLNAAKDGMRVLSTILREVQRTKPYLDPATLAAIAQRHRPLGAVVPLVTAAALPTEPDRLAAAIQRAAQGRDGHGAEGVAADDPEKIDKVERLIVQTAQDLEEDLREAA